MTEEPQKQPQDNELQQYHQRQRQLLLDLLRQMKVQCLLYAPGHLMPAETRAYVFAELQGLADLYKPKMEVG